MAPDGLAVLEEAAGEGNRRVVRAQLVGVGDAAREHERHVVGRVGVTDRGGGVEGVGPVEVVEGLDGLGLGCEQLRRAPRRLDRLPGLR
jgi:hypothetical protein